MAEVVVTYTAHLDSKHRITLRGAKYDYYHVQEFADGCILLEPRELVPPAGISSPLDDDTLK